MLKPLGDRVVIRVLEQEEKLQAVSFYRTPLKKNRVRVKSSPLVRASFWMTGNALHWMLKLAIKSFSRNMLVRKSNSKARLG